MLENRGMRHFLLSRVKDVKTAVRWSNGMQALAESLPHGIPVNLSSDPRHGAGAEGAEFRSAADGVSQWPEGLALAACRDQDTVRRFAKTMAREYRALGIVTFLGPQIDLGTDPRWFRIRDTFGSDAEWTVRMTKAFCDGLQTTEGSENGWGRDSVIAMAKHWPGGGTGEGEGTLIIPSASMPSIPAATLRPICGLLRKALSGWRAKPPAAGRSCPITPFPGGRTKPAMKTWAIPTIPI